MKLSWRKATAAIAVLAVAAAGFGVYVVPAFGGNPTAEEVIRKAAGQAKIITSGHATVSITSNDLSLVGPLVAEVWSQKPGQFRAEVRQTPIGNLAGLVAVSDGTNFWAYQQVKNQVIIGNKADFPNGKTPFDALNQLSDYNQLVDKLLQNADAALLGNETIDGVSTYKLTLTPKPGDGSEDNPTITVWIDSSRFIPVKGVLTTEDGEFTFQAKNIEINPQLSPALWSFTPPAGAEVVYARDLQPETLTLDQARAMSSIRVMVPEQLPAGASLTKVQRVGQGVVQSYTFGTTSFTIWAGPADAGRVSLGRVAEQITIHGQPASVATAGGQTVVAWQESGFAYVITGDISKEDAIAIANSLN